jgi:hypothetical protein
MAKAIKKIKMNFLGRGNIRAKNKEPKRIAKTITPMFCDIDRFSTRGTVGKSLFPTQSLEDKTIPLKVAKINTILVQKI